jgi:DNA polymerase-1
MEIPLPNVVRTVDDAMEMFRWLSAERVITFDTETTDTAVFSPDFRVRLVQFGTVDDAWVIEMDRWRGLVANVFDRYEGRLVAHNARFDILALAHEGIEVPWRQVDDTMIALRLAEPTESAALKAACDRHVSSASSTGQKILSEAFRRQKWDWATVPIDFPAYLYYAAADTVLTARLYESDVVQRGLASPVYALEMQTRAVCAGMERTGFRVNLDTCASWSRKLGEESDEIKARCESLYGVAVTSTASLSHWFLSEDEARPHLLNRTPGGKVSVDRETLERIVHYCTGPAKTLAAEALQVRKADKVNGTYFRNFMWMSDGDGLLHPQIETIAARTGRMSVRDPALQTLPKHSPDPAYKAVRQAVIPLDTGQTILSCDFNQIELRLLSSLSRDPGLIGAFVDADAAGSDFFTEMARTLYAEPGFTKGDPRRNVVKTYMYAAAYGAGVEKMAITAGLPVAQIHEVKGGMADRFPGFFRFSTESQHLAESNSLWVETSYGRRLKVDGHRVYTACNAIIQGTAADVMKQAIVGLAQAGLEPMMLLPVHDEIVLSVPVDDLDEVKHIVSRTMANADFTVPLTADSASGDTWGDCG